MASLLLRRVAELNNSGASMLVASRDKEAFKTLQTALTIMEQEMLGSSDRSESSTSSRLSTTSNTSSNDTRSSTSSMATSATAESVGSAAPSNESDEPRFAIDTAAIPELKDDRYFIFNQVLLVVEAGGTEPSSAIPSGLGTASGDIADTEPANLQSLVCFFTSVVIYNLALAYHKRGMIGIAGSSSPSPSDTNITTATTTPPVCTAVSNARIALSQSLRLYEHCLKIVRSIANYSEDGKMLLYAVSCNLAHLYCRKGDRSRAQQLLDGLDEANRFSYQNLI